MSRIRRHFLKVADGTGQVIFGYHSVCGGAGPDWDDRLDWELEHMMKEPKIDLDAVGVDLDRLGRSLLLQGERVGDGRYHVTGGEHDHWVDLYTTSHPRCDCGDHLWRDQLCKHILAALLREGHDRVVEALGPLFRQRDVLRTSRVGA
jgi:hypothetical protein